MRSGIVSIVNNESVIPNVSREAGKMLRSAARTLRKGDYVSLYDGEVSHRYAGRLGSFDTMIDAGIALRLAGFTLVDSSPYLPMQKWEISAK
jgi:hypothetical protein